MLPAVNPPARIAFHAVQQDKVIFDSHMKSHEEGSWAELSQVNDTKNKVLSSIIDKQMELTKDVLST